MNRYLFVFRFIEEESVVFGNPSNIEIIAEDADEALHKIEEAFGIKRVDFVRNCRLVLMTENFECPKCRPELTECNYNGG